MSITDFRHSRSFRPSIIPILLTSLLFLSLPSPYYSYFSLLATPSPSRYYGESFSFTSDLLAEHPITALQSDYKTHLDISMKDLAFTGTLHRSLPPGLYFPIGTIRIDDQSQFYFYSQTGQMSCQLSSSSSSSSSSISTPQQLIPIFFSFSKPVSHSADGDESGSDGSIDSDMNLFDQSEPYGYKSITIYAYTRKLIGPVPPTSLFSLTKNEVYRLLCPPALAINTLSPNTTNLPSVVSIRMGFTNQEAESQTSLIFSQFKPSHDPNVSNAIPRLELTNLELQQGIGANFTFAYFPPSFPLGPVHPPMDHFITWFPLFTDDRVYKGRRLGKFVADFLDKNLFGNGIPCLSGPSNRKTIVGFFHPRLTNLDKLKSFVFPLDSLSVDDSNSNGYSEVDDTFGPKITFSEVFARTQCFFSFTIPLHLLFTEIYGYYGDILGSSALS